MGLVRRAGGTTVGLLLHQPGRLWVEGLHSLAHGETVLPWELDLQVILFVSSFLPSFGGLKWKESLCPHISIYLHSVPYFELLGGFTYV